MACTTTRSGPAAGLSSAAPAGELGGGLVGLEVATLSSLPPAVAASDAAGGAEMRLRVPHRYEGRDSRYMGETNTTCDPWGHLLISVIGNYDQQGRRPHR